MNWKGDPNATLSGGDVPAPQPGSAPAPPTLVPALAAAEYDPATGAYVAPDGNTYYNADLAKGTDKPTLQSMLMPGAE